MRAQFLTSFFVVVVFVLVQIFCLSPYILLILGWVQHDDVNLWFQLCGRLRLEDCLSLEFHIGLVH